MHFISTKQDLLWAINIVQRAITAKSPMPILAGIRFELNANQLSVTATDMEMGIVCGLPVGEIEPGVAVLPSKYITELVRRLPDGDITFLEDQENGSMVIKYGDSESIINCFPAGEFPDVQIPAGGNKLVIKENLLREALRRILFAVAADDRRAALNGAEIAIEDDSIEIVATDLHRLAWCKIGTETHATGKSKALVPGKALAELSKIIGKTDSNVSIALVENNIIFLTENIAFITRLLEGQFPKYKQVVPKNSLTKITIKRQALLEATERAALFSTEENTSIRIIVQANSMIIKDTTVVGRIHEEMPISKEGEDTEIGLNVHYLSDLLKAMESEEIEIELSGSQSPGVFRPVGEKDYFSLIVPMYI